MYFASPYFIRGWGIATADEEENCKRKQTMWSVRGVSFFRHYPESHIWQHMALPSNGLCCRTLRRTMRVCGIQTTRRYMLSTPPRPRRSGMSLSKNAGLWASACARCPRCAPIAVALLPWILCGDHCKEHCWLLGRSTRKKQ